MIPLFKVRMEPKAIEEASKVLKSGYIGQGPKNTEFEEALEKYFNHPYVVTTNSATSAEHLAFHMLKDMPDGRGYEGCEVLCSPLTCTATNWPVVLNGYKIKWVDVDTNTCNMDLDDLARKLTFKTKIIYLCCWGGFPNDYEKIYDICYRCVKKFGFWPVIIEDCAHGFGSMYETNGGMHKNKIGVLYYVNNSWFSTFSFQAIKHTTSVDGGCLLCPDRETYNRAKLLRWYGIDRESPKREFRCEEDIEEVGFKFHLNDVSAAVGLENLKTVDQDISARKYNAIYYDENVINPQVREIPYNDNCSYWLYTMFVDRQEDFIKYMTEKRIQVSRVHERNDKHSCMKEFQAILPNLDKVVSEMICIPVGLWVTHENLEYIVDCINEGW